MMVRAINRSQKKIPSKKVDRKSLPDLIRSFPLPVDKIACTFVADGLEPYMQKSAGARLRLFEKCVAGNISPYLLQTMKYDRRRGLFVPGGMKYSPVKNPYEPDNWSYTCINRFIGGARAHMLHIRELGDENAAMLFKNWVLPSLERDDYRVSWLVMGRDARRAGRQDDDISTMRYGFAYEYISEDSMKVTKTLSLVDSLLDQELSDKLHDWWSGIPSKKQ